MTHWKEKNHKVAHPDTLKMVHLNLYKELRRCSPVELAQAWQQISGKINHYITTFLKYPILEKKWTQSKKQQIWKGETKSTTQRVNHKTLRNNLINEITMCLTKSQLKNRGSKQLTTAVVISESLMENQVFRHNLISKFSIINKWEFKYD